MGNVQRILSNSRIANWKISQSLWAIFESKAWVLRALVVKHKKMEHLYFSTSIFPPEITIEILSWLPIKSQVKLQLVCKEWRAIVHDHHFVEKHTNRSVCTWNFYNVLNPNRESTHESAIHLHGCDGLLLLCSPMSPKMYYIWNPATRSMLTLPDPCIDSLRMVLAYVPDTRDYRIVSIYDDKDSRREGCQVLTLGESMKWRKLAFPDIVKKDGVRERLKISVVSIGTIVHCVCIVKVGAESSAVVVVSLDLRTECFIITHLPSGVFKNLRKIWDLEWFGKLALVDIVGKHVEVMELEDWKKGKWSQKKKIIPLPFMKEEKIDEGNLLPLFAKQGDIWFWLNKNRIVTFTAETGCLTDVVKSDISPFDNNLYVYKPSLVTFKGMQPDTRFQRLRPPSLV